MPMNLVIQERRKILGMTQEQVAEFLNVSAPAVSKWETGATNPDISILPQLARLLKIDLNALFCFQEELSHQEIASFCSQIAQRFQSEGIYAVFEAAKEKIRQFPHNDALLHALSIQLQSYLHMSGLSPAERIPFEENIQSWYRQLADSADPLISSSAKYMLASGYIHTGEYEKAQAVLDTMPNNHDLLNQLTDKNLLQVTIYQRQGDTDRAAKELQQALLFAAQRVQMLLYKLLDTELAAGNLDTARTIAEKTSRLTPILDLWEYSAYPAPLQIAFWEKNQEQAIALIRKMLDSMGSGYDNTGTALFNRVPSFNHLSSMLPMILDELEHDPAYDFLRDHPSFQELLLRYRA